MTTLSCQHNDSKIKYHAHEDSIYTYIELKSENVFIKQKFITDGFLPIKIEKIYHDSIIIDTFLNFKIFDRIKIKNNKKLETRFKLNLEKIRSSEFLKGLEGWKRDGYDTLFFSLSNTPKLVIRYRDGMKNGEYKIYKEKGRVFQRVFFRNDSVVGLIDYESGEKSGDTIITK